MRHSCIKEVSTVFNLLHPERRRTGFAIASALLLLLLTLLAPAHNCGTAPIERDNAGVISSSNPVCMACVIGTSIAIFSLVLLVEGLTVKPGHVVLREASIVSVPRCFGYYLRPPPTATL